MYTKKNKEPKNGSHHTIISQICEALEADARSMRMINEIIPKYSQHSAYDLLLSAAEAAKYQCDLIIDFCKEDIEMLRPEHGE